MLLDFSKSKISPQMREILQANDRRGERAIAWFQTSIAVIVIGFHLVSASRNQWQTFSWLTVAAALLILLACAARLLLAKWEKLPTVGLHLLSVVDGALIFLLISSYSYAYGLPFETIFKAPSIVFLIVYTCLRALKLDPLPIVIAGVTILSGWIGMLLTSIWLGAKTTQSYVEYISSEKILVGATVEMAAGYVAVILILATATSYGRRILANTADMKELAQAKQLLEGESARLMAIFQSSTDGILVVDERGVVENMNPAVEQMFGYPSEDLIGSSVAALMSPDNAGKLSDDIGRFLNNQETRLVGRPFESEGIRRNGERFPIELSISNFIINGEARFSAIVRDISERREFLKKEKLANSKFRDVVDTALDAIVVIDEDGMIVEFNPAAETLFGYASTDVVGTEMAGSIVPEHHREAHRQGMKHYLETGEGPVLNQRIEIDAITADGKSILIELAIKVGEGGDGRQFFGYIRDITAKKAAEDALIHAKERAEVANRAKASFLAMMSHEIRTPLNGVLGILTLLADSVKDQENGKLIETARRSGRALLTIINDILDFSKLEAGKLDIELGSFHIEALTDSVSSLVQHQAKAKSLTVNVEVGETVPRVLVGDQDRIRQIMLNLVWNAIKFTEKGEIKVLVEAVGDPKDARVSFSVQDSGVGVPADREDELFSEFSTIDASYARKFGGTGLGLSICKALTDAMKGEIGYRPNSPKGSIFWFELPLDIGKASDVVEEQTEESAKEILDGFGKIRILLAEDNVTNQLVVSNMLERLGCQVDVVGNGQEAVDSLVERQYDVVLMDVSMPEMDGIEATKAIRKLKTDAVEVPIVALTAYAMDEDRQRVLAAGMDDFVAKPVSRIELAGALSRQLDKSTRAQGFIPEDHHDNRSAFDEKIWNSIFGDMDDELTTKIVREFQGDIKRHLAAMTEAVATKNEDQFEKATHGLKGVSGTFGATELQRITGEANDKIRQGAADKAFDKADAIILLCNRALDAVEARIAFNEGEESKS